MQPKDKALKIEDDGADFSQNYYDWAILN